jgi:hypothetical protein
MTMCFNMFWTFSVPHKLRECFCMEKFFRWKFMSVLSLDCFLQLIPLIFARFSSYCSRVFIKIFRTESFGKQIVYAIPPPHTAPPHPPIRLVLGIAKVRLKAWVATETWFMSLNLVLTYWKPGVLREKPAKMSSKPGFRRPDFMKVWTKYVNWQGLSTKTCQKPALNQV